MNYQHSYHAGNFADVFKHVILVMLIEALCKKDKPFCYLDTHAGVGKYDLTSKAAQKTREYENGILRLYNRHDYPAPVKLYLDIINSMNETPSERRPMFPRFYPGSPLIAQSLLRSQDNMILVELDEKLVKALKQDFFYDKRVAVHHADGYQSLKAFLPPAKRRGLILIDPPFEEPNEFKQVISALESALKTFPTGVYAVWYPIKDIAAVRNFQKRLKELDAKNTLVIELSIAAIANMLGLTGCGMAIINAPWQLDEQLNSVIPWLWKILSPKRFGEWGCHAMSGAYPKAEKQ